MNSMENSRRAVKEQQHTESPGYEQQTTLRHPQKAFTLFLPPSSDLVHAAPTPTHAKPETLWCPVRSSASMLPTKWTINVHFLLLYGKFYFYHYQTVGTWAVLDRRQWEVKKQRSTNPITGVTWTASPIHRLWRLWYRTISISGLRTPARHTANEWTCTIACQNLPVETISLLSPVWTSSVPYDHKSSCLTPGGAKQFDSTWAHNVKSIPTRWEIEKIIGYYRGSRNDFRRYVRTLQNFRKYIVTNNNLMDETVREYVLAIIIN